MLGGDFKMFYINILYFYPWEMIQFDYSFQWVEKIHQLGWVGHWNFLLLQMEDLLDPAISICLQGILGKSTTQHDQSKSTSRSRSNSVPNKIRKSWLRLRDSSQNFLIFLFILNKWVSWSFRFVKVFGCVFCWLFLRKPILVGENTPVCASPKT